MTEDLAKEVEKWLKKSGYPLEMEVAQTLKNAGFSVVQSEYFEDNDTDKWRETDVVAYHENPSNGACKPIFATVIECKGDPSKPWVLFSAADNYPTSLSVSRRATSNDGSRVLHALSVQEQIKDLTMFTLPARPAYGITCAFLDTDKKASQPDIAYRALQSVCKATNGLIKRLEDIEHQKLLPFAWPVIVINAPLFESYLNDDGKLEVSELSSGTLVWRNPLVNRHSLIQIVTKKQLDQYANDLFKDASFFLTAVSETFDLLFLNSQDS